MENESIQHIQEYLSIKKKKTQDKMIPILPKKRKKEIKRSNIWELSGPSLDFYTFAAFCN